jgi:RNA polymerase sigma factor (sigma-70 family)
MTAAVPNWDIVSDAQLAGAAARGDRTALGGIYDRYADRLHDFCIGMLRDREAAADCVQETFCTAAIQLPKLREPDKLRPWLYAIARNEALRCIRRRGRENISDELPDRQSSDAGPDTLAGRTELASLVAEAEGGLSDRDREVLDLSYRHGLDGSELAEALGVSPANAVKLVSRMRETVERSLGALLVARRVQRNPQGCPELGAILAGWDGQFSVLMRKRVARHIDSCDTCERTRRNLVNPKALLGAVPVLVAAPWWLRGQTMTKVQLTSAHSPMAAAANAGSADTVSGAPTDAFDRRPTDAFDGPDTASHAEGGASKADAGGGRFTNLIKGAAVLIGILILSGGIALWLHRNSPSVTPSNVITQTTPARAPVSAPASAQTQPSAPQLPSPPAGPTVAPSYKPTPANTPAPRAPISTPVAVPTAQAPQPSGPHAPVGPPVWVPPGPQQPAPYSPPQGTPPRQTPGYSAPAPTPSYRAPSPTPSYSPPKLTTPAYSPPKLTTAPPSFRPPK